MHFWHFNTQLRLYISQFLLYISQFWEIKSELWDKSRAITFFIFHSVAETSLHVKQTAAINHFFFVCLFLFFSEPLVNCMSFCSELWENRNHYLKQKEIVTLSRIMQLYSILGNTNGDIFEKILSIVTCYYNK